MKDELLNMFKDYLLGKEEFLSFFNVTLELDQNDMRDVINILNDYLKPINYKNQLSEIILFFEINGFKEFNKLDFKFYIKADFSREFYHKNTARVLYHFIKRKLENK